MANDNYVSGKRASRKEPRKDDLRLKLTYGDAEKLGFVDPDTRIAKHLNQLSKIQLSLGTDDVTVEFVFEDGILTGYSLRGRNLDGEGNYRVAARKKYSVEKLDELIAAEEKELKKAEELKKSKESY